MTDSLLLNPMTVGRLTHAKGAPAALSLSCYAQRRSSQAIEVERAREPELFAALLAWLDGSGPPALPALDIIRKLHFWSQGLLISPDELKAVPRGAKPAIGDGHQLASALCPQVADLLRGGPGLPALPFAPDPDLAEAGYCSVPPLLAPEDLAAMSVFYATLSAGDWLNAGTGKDTGQRGFQNDPVARRVHYALTPYFAAMFGQDIKPSYAYAQEYCRSAALPRHTDRMQCEFTFSLYVDYQPEPASELCPWPLIVHAPGGDVAINQPRGGGVVVRGRTLPHSRPPLPPGHSAMMVLLHYVDAAFSSSLD